MANTLPKSVRLRSYQVGFGDCFLLTLSYESGDRHVLFDFGTTAPPKNAQPDLLLRVADDIAEVCRHGADPLAIVASHRHQDHIQGFARGKNRDRAGEIVRKLKPKLVVQPWTEDPALPTNAMGPPTSSAASPELGFVRRLANMQQVGLLAARETERSKDSDRQADRIHFMGSDAIKNRDAVENLMTMGPNEYLHFGKRSGLAKMLPGVKAHVLGPPTLRQTETIRKQRRGDADEFWKALGLAAGAGSSLDDVPEQLESPFAEDEHIDVPVSARWFTRRVQSVRKSQLLQIVRALDDAMNNTSLILLLEIGSLSLLFPGDAQIENWKYALERPSAQKLLRRVRVYKVGHHGSGNATPKSLWELFEHRSADAKKPSRLTSMLSTLAGKHSGVPAGTLVDALRCETTHVTTARTTKLYRDLVWKRRGPSWSPASADQAKSDA